MTCTVVYIDDEPHLCTVFKEFFSSSTSSVYTFTEAEPAIDFCEKNNIKYHIKFGTPLSRKSTMNIFNE